MKLNLQMNDLLKLVTAVGVAELAGFLGSFFSVASIPSWYATLTKPELTPPGWIFAPVWTTLYALMGIAAFIVWRHGLGHPRVRMALVIFGVQLALNTLWSVLFFGLQSPGLALLEIIVLWIAIVSTMIAFARISSAAAWLLVPYILWVSFAAYLNYSIWMLN